MDYEETILNTPELSVRSMAETSSRKKHRGQEIHQIRRLGERIL